MIRVRFAPSPTGDLHVGGARTALFNWLYARRQGGTFILRIEDTDGARNTEEAQQGIVKALKWLGLDWDEGPEKGGPHEPYFQSRRKPIYDAYLAKLQAAGRVYEEENGAIRFKFSRQPIMVKDLVCGDVTFAATEEPDMTIRRPDGSYIFHFVNVVDDIEMRMTHVFRGEDHLSNTWKHIDLFHALGAEPPLYAHIPLILNPDGSKMSKRDEGSAVEKSYLNEGFLPEAVFNYLAMVGWTPRSEKEILTATEMVALFEPAEIHSANARFDLKKCLWFNAQYIRAASPERLWQAARPFLVQAGIPVENEPLAQAAIYSVREKISLLKELPEWVHYFFNEDFTFEAEALDKLKSKPENPTLLSQAHAHLQKAQDWSEHGIHEALALAATEAGVKVGALMPLLRFSLSGQSRGPGVTTIAHLIGQPKTLSRLERALRLIGE